MVVRELWRYPVKSIGGERVESSRLDEFGLLGDRRAGIRDNRTGMFLTARREPKLLMATATLTDAGPVVHLDDGTSTSNSSVLSKWIGRDVSLVAAGAGEATYESPTDAVLEDEWYTWTGPGSALHDEPFARVSLISTRSLMGWDVRRIRPNIVIDGDDISLIGHSVQVGSAQLKVTEEILRCVMVTRPQPGLGRDLDVLKVINRKRNGKLSVGALVQTSGEIKVGNAILSDSHPQLDNAGS